jgi:hypothetical protein
MYYNFDTDSVEHAKAALLLYAMYRSRNKNSSLNGLETWDRFNSYVRGASLKSKTTAEFVQNFCRLAKVDSVKPKYLASVDGLTLLPTGEVIESSQYKDFKLKIMEDNSLLRLFETEGLYLIMLVRERIQREKATEIEEDENE